MEETREMDQDPFSMERAYATFEENMRTARRLREEIRQGREKGEPDRELLLKGAEALGRLTDNTILRRIVQKGLEARDAT